MAKNEARLNDDKYWVSMARNKFSDTIRKESHLSTANSIIENMLSEYCRIVKDKLKKEYDIAEKVEAAYRMPEDTDAHRWALKMLKAMESSGDDEGME